MGEEETWDYPVYPGGSPSFCLKQILSPACLGVKFLFCVQGWKELGGFHLRGERGAWAHPGCRKAAQGLSPVWEGEKGGEGGDPQPLLWDPC